MKIKEIFNDLFKLVALTLALIVLNFSTVIGFKLIAIALLVLDVVISIYDVIIKAKENKTDENKN